MLEEFPQQCSDDRFVRPEFGQDPVEWRRDIPEERLTPDELFSRDGRIGERYQLQGFGAMTPVGRAPIAEGFNWAEDATQIHSLRAVVNARGNNYGIVTTSVDGQDVVYITRFGDEPQSGSFVGMLSGSQEDGFLVASGTTLSPQDDALFSVCRMKDGGIYIINEAVDSPVTVGAGKEKPAEEGHRFSLRSILGGVKKAVRGQQPTPDRNILSGKMVWMAPPDSIARNARWMRDSGYGWPNN